MLTADRVPAYWLDAPGIDPSQVLVFVHGGGFQLGSLRSHGELAARLGRASGMRVLFPEYRLVPDHPFPAAIDEVHRCHSRASPTATAACSATIRSCHPC